MEERLVVLDTETTGMSVEDGHRIVEIGCVELIARRLTGRDFHRRINPGRAIDASASAVHGIRDADVIHEPRFDEIADSFLEYASGATLVIHNAAFDLAFLDMELRRAGRAPMRTLCNVVDTLPISRLRHPGQRNSLDALCRRYAIDASSRAEVHGALIDAALLAEVYLAMTAGQAAMAFDEHEQTAPKKSLLLAHLAQSAHKLLPVIKATADEAASHETRMHSVRQAHLKALEIKRASLQGEIKSLAEQLRNIEHRVAARPAADKEPITQDLKDTRKICEDLERKQAELADMEVKLTEARIAGPSPF